MMTEPIIVLLALMPENRIVQGGLMTKYCTRGTSCPEEKRIGRCLKFKDPDGIISDKHYYSGTTKNHKLQPSFIKETCINNGGSFLDH